MAVATGTAILGAAAIGAVGSAYAGNQQSKAANRATRAGSAAEANRLAFDQEQYDDWEKVYGPIQERLSSFYSSLDPTTFAAQGVQQLQQAHGAQMEQMQRSFAQRGIESPAQEAMQQQAGLDLARGSAAVRQQAPMMLANAQQGFLNQNASNPAAQAISSGYGAQASRQFGAAQQAQGMAAQGYQAAGQSISSGVGAYFQHQAYQNQMQQLQTANTTIPGVTP